MPKIIAGKLDLRKYRNSRIPPGMFFRYISIVVGGGVNPEPSSNLGRKRILVVDDERAIRETLSPILRKYGFTVTVAATVAHALNEIETREFDLLQKFIESSKR